MSKNNNDEKSFSRRDFLKTTAALTGYIIGGSVLGGMVGYNLDNENNVENSGTEIEGNQTSNDADNLNEARTFFKRRTDFDILSAAVEKIFPESTVGPDTVTLGVPYFIDCQLST